jgi:hypothetical protein
VICKSKGYNRTYGCKGFIEEVVDEPRDHEKLGRQGLYSIYGLDKANSDGVSSEDDLYFGDHAGRDLEATGDKMTIVDITEYLNRQPENKLLQKDMDRVTEELI